MSLFEAESASGELQTAEGLLALLDLPGIGPARAIALARRFSTAAEFGEASASELADVAGKAAAEHVGRELDVRSRQSDDASFRLVGFFDDDYPVALRALRAPAPVLWTVGTLPPRDVIAVVGTRHPSDWGRRAARLAAESAADAGLGVVSGLALGIDTEAHEGALAAGSTTWAFLGGGVTTPTPAGNRDLARRIVEHGGGLLAEVPPGTRPSAQTLVARNRLQAGSAKATVVAECGIPSGTLHTARFTLEHGSKLVVTLPSGALAGEASFAGCRALADPDGCDPEVLSARGPTADLVRRRHPVADFVAHRREDLDEYWSSMN